MLRRDFLQGACFAALVSTMGARLGAASASPAQASFNTLRGDVGYFVGKGGTIGWLASKDGLAVVDTQFPEFAGPFLAEMPDRAGRLIDVVVNTHHHGDHTAGNPVFLRECKRMVAHRRVPLLQMRAAERAGNLHKQAFAKELFDTVWSLGLGSEKLTCTHYGAAHTGGDVVVAFEKANVFHLGDLVFNRRYPVMDPNGQCTVLGWIAVLETLQRQIPKDALLIYGHAAPSFGVTGLYEDLGVMRDYLSALVELVQKAVSEGRERSALDVPANMPGFPDFHVPEGKGNRFGSNFLFVYDELTRSQGL